MSKTEVINRSARTGTDSMHLPQLGVKQVHISGEGVSDEHLTALHAGRAAILASAVELILTTGEVVVDVDKTIEPRRSAHQVGFGSFIKRVGQTDKSEQPIALKPFSRAGKALDEVHGYLTLGELGVETLEPVGIFPAKNGDHYISITKKRNDLTSLDRDRWVVGRQIKDEASLEIAQRNNETVKGIAETMGYIHSNSVYHPDGQIKNYAKTPTGEIGIVDTENLIATSPDDPNGMEYAWTDIEKLTKSLIINTQIEEDVDIFGVGMLYGLPLQSVRSSLDELLITPYLESLAQQLEGADEAKSQHIQQLFDGIAERFHKDETWPSHFIEASKAVAYSTSKAA